MALFRTATAVGTAMDPRTAHRPVLGDSLQQAAQTPRVEAAPAALEVNHATAQQAQVAPAPLAIVQSNPLASAQRSRKNFVRHHEKVQVVLVLYHNSSVVQLSPNFRGVSVNRGRSNDSFSSRISPGGKPQTPRLHRAPPKTQTFRAGASRAQVRRLP